MRRTTLLLAFAALLCAAPNAFAQGGAAKGRQPVQRAGKQRVQFLELPKGDYRLTLEDTSDLTCRQARQYFQQVLDAPAGTLPDGWEVDPATRTFARDDGSDAF